MRTASALLLIVALISGFALLSGTALAEAGLVAEWHLDEGTGTKVNDSSGYYNNCTTYNTTWANGKFGTAPVFNGTNTEVNCGNKSGLSIQGPITLEAWYKLGSYGTDWYDILWKSSTYSSYSGYMMFTGTFVGSRSLVGVAFGNSIWEPSAGAGYPVLNTWYHLVFTYDGATIRGYLNGNSLGTYPAPTVWTSTTLPVMVGAGNYGNAGVYSFNGSIDEVRVYNRALSPAEVAAHAACNYSGIGNWNITVPTYCRAKIVVNNSNITVSTGGKLMLDNSTLIMNATKIDGSQLIVESGELWVNRSFLTTGNATVTWPFQIYSNTTILDSYVNYTGWAYTTRGIQITNIYYPQFVLFKNSYFWTYRPGNPGASITTNYCDNLILINNTFIADNWPIYFSTLTAVPVFDSNKVICYSGGCGVLFMYWSNLSSFNSTFTGTSISENIHMEGVPSLFYGSGNQFAIDKTNIYAGAGAIWSENHNLGGKTMVWGDLNITPGWPPGTAAFWHFDEGSGTVVNDETTGNNDGALGGGAKWVDGVYGKAVNFSASGDYIKVSDNNALDTYDFATFEGYYKFYNLTWRNDIYMYNRGVQSGTTGFSIVYFYSPTQDFCMQYSNGTTIQGPCYYSGPLEVNKWYHFAITVDNIKKEIKFYRDRVLRGTWSGYTGTAMPVISGDAYFGGYQGDHRFKGAVDEVRISRRVLQPNEFLPRGKDDTIIANANISFIAGVNITFDNTTIIMNQSSNGEHRLHMRDNSFVRFIGCNITNAPNNYNYFMGNGYGARTFIQRTNIYGHRNDWSGYPAESFLGMVDIRNSTLRAQAGYTLFLNGATAPTVVENSTIIGPAGGISLLLNTLPANMFLHKINATQTLNIFNYNATIINSTLQNIQHNSGNVVTFTLLNSTQSGTTSFATTYAEILHTWFFSAIVQDSDGAAISGADINLTDKNGKIRYLGQTGANGMIFWNVTEYNVSQTGTTYYSPYTLKARKTGVGNNSIVINISKSMDTGIILSGTQYGYGVVGTPETEGITDLKITIGGVEGRGPFDNNQTVIIYDGTMPLIELVFNFSRGNLNIGNWVVKRGANWTGISDNALPVTLYVPLLGTYCNVVKCDSITDPADACLAGWDAATATVSGETCKAYVTGTVIVEDDDAVGTGTVIAAPEFDMLLVAALFTVATVVLVLRRRLS